MLPRRAEPRDPPDRHAGTRGFHDRGRALAARARRGGGRVFAGSTASSRNRETVWHQADRFHVPAPRLRGTRWTVSAPTSPSVWVEQIREASRFARTRRRSSCRSARRARPGRHRPGPLGAPSTFTRSVRADAPIEGVRSSRASPTPRPGASPASGWLETDRRKDVDDAIGEKPFLENQPIDETARCALRFRRATLRESCGAGARRRGPSQHRRPAPRSTCSCCDYLPSPARGAAGHGRRPRNSRTRSLPGPLADGAPLGALAFKVVMDEGRSGFGLLCASSPAR